MNELDEYLRANRDAYTREALTRRLVEEGHDPAEVEAAWTRIERRPISEWGPGDASADPPHGTAGIGSRLLVVLAILVYGGSIALAGFAISAGGGISLVMILYIVAMLFGLRHAVRRLLAASAKGTGLTPIWGAAAVAIVIYIGLSGACFAALGPATNLLGGRIF